MEVSEKLYVWDSEESGFTDLKIMHTSILEEIMIQSVEYADIKILNEVRKLMDQANIDPWR